MKDADLGLSTIRRDLYSRWAVAQDHGISQGDFVRAEVGRQYERLSGVFVGVNAALREMAASFRRFADAFAAEPDADVATSLGISLEPLEEEP